MSTAPPPSADIVKEAVQLISPSDSSNSISLLSLQMTDGPHHDQSMEEYSPDYFKTNVNLYMENWLQQFIVCSAFITLTLAILTFAFQLTHPKSRRNMGRFFLIILGLQSFDKIAAIVQILYIGDLSKAYWEIDQNVPLKSDTTRVCQMIGFFSTFCDYMSQFYALWFAVLIKQIIKDPIHRLQKLICFFHVVTFMISSILTAILSKFNTFGVQEDLSCGVMFTSGLDDEVLMIVPFVLVPIQLYFVSKITRQTPFIIRQSLKRFVRKYTFYVVFLMSMQCMQVIMMVFGSRNPKYFDYDTLDGYKRWRYGYIILDHVTYLCLVFVTIYEPVFQKACMRVINKLLCRRTPSKASRISKKLQPLLAVSPKRYQEGDDDQEEKSCSMAFEQQNKTDKKTYSDSSDDNFEEGSNQIELRSEMDIVDKDKFENLVTDYANFNEQFAHMSIKQKTSYFIINTVLMSICHCIIHANEQEEREKNQGIGENFIAAVKSLTYQLKENDIYHIMDMANFFKKNSHLCVSDVTNGKKVQIKVSEYDRDICHNIRRKSGYDNQYFLKNFAPKENHVQMTKFQIGSGKSDSFFFYTASNQFIIKTLKEEELKLLVRKGVLEKYYYHLRKNKQSMLARFYGIYTVKIKYMKPISVVIMDNLMGDHLNEIQRIYDLKGSTHKRISKKIKNNRSVRKDLNFLLDSDQFLRLSPILRSEFKKRLYRDKEFLKSCHLMDYSLLLIIFKRSEWRDADSDEEDPTHQIKNQTPKQHIFVHTKSNGEQVIDIEEEGGNNGPENATGNYMITSPLKRQDQDVQPQLEQSIDWKLDHQQQEREDSWDHEVDYESVKLKPRVKEFIQEKNYEDPLIYYRFGIIDFLQGYTKKKKIETIYLRKRYNKKPQNCFSCVDPHTYGDRFYEFLLKNLFTQHRFFPECEIEKDKKNTKDSSPFSRMNSSDSKLRVGLFGSGKSSNK